MLRGYLQIGSKEALPLDDKTDEHKICPIKWPRLLTNDIAP